ncbi:MAG: cyclic pyranopterin monophosphate synthase MoaC [Eubacteriales bacterium]|nr:cyclic pyranopterin monophosphate synthase MoaC [Eubacteriales bacterium]
MNSFTHIDEHGDARMVDVGEKAVTRREASAEGYIAMSRECFSMIEEGRHKKGDVLGVAQVAGIMGAKQNSALIPLCHLIGLTKADLQFETGARPECAREELCYIRAVCTTACEGKTGVEMEALTGVSIALLTIYDMCKAVDRSMEITEIRLLRKSGGKSGLYERGK